MLTFILLFIIANVTMASLDCSRKCIKKEITNAIGVRYGKYCGIGYTGCVGEQPCDPLDNCCMVHDQCVGRTGLQDCACHKQLLDCTNAVINAPDVKGFTNKRQLLEKAGNTIKTGMQLSILITCSGRNT
jgi:hypothetical protein